MIIVTLQINIVSIPPALLQVFDRTVEDDVRISERVGCNRDSPCRPLELPVALVQPAACFNLSVQAG